MPRSIALVMLLALLWGAGFPLTKMAVETLPPLTVAAVRALLGGLLLLAVLGPRARLLWASARNGDTFFVQAIFNCIVPWALVAWASRIIEAGLATILNSLSPIFIFLITWAITRHEPATPRKFVGVVLGLAGVLAIIGMNALAGVGGHTLAELACVAGSISYAIAGVIGRRYDNVPALVPAAGAALMGAAVLVPLALVFEPWPAAPSMRSMLAVLALAVFSTGAAFVVYFRLLSTIGSIATASQAYLRILVGVGLSVGFLGEAFTAAMAVGMVLVVAGVVAMTLPPRRL
jgi:drug/metabolite transporter (DMT)-like permease